MTNNLASKLKLLLIMVLLGIMFFPYQLTYAVSSTDLQKQIDQKQKELNGTQSNLAKAQQDYQNYQKAVANAKGGLPALEAQINEINSEINVNNAQKELLEESKNLKELEKAQKEDSQKESVKDTYMDWRANEPNDIVVLFDQSQYDFKKFEEYSQTVLADQQEKILGLSTELTDLDNNISDFNKKLADLNAQNASLASKKAQIQAQIDFYNSRLYAAGSSISNLQSSIKSIKTNIASLSQQQKVAMEQEAAILAKSSVGASVSGCGTYDDANNNNSINFCGLGRDNYQGHGVGMSQYGAKGEAEKGWSASKILTFYYTGTQVAQYNLNSQITVKYCTDNPALDAFQDGAGGNTCNDGKPPVTERVSFDTYLAGLGEMPQSWYFEARKAQIIAARTYAAKYTNNGDPNTPICLTVYCQVSYFKSGNQTEKDAVDATKDLVILYGGSLVDALYSSDNNQGFGTANNDTRFQGYSGNGTPYPYLRAVNDNAYADKTTYTTWGYKTNKYSIDQINSLVNYVASNSGVYGSFASYVSSVKNQIGGKVVSLSFERDPSKRVKKVWLKGVNGASASIGGYWFKYMWNVWIGNNHIMNNQNPQSYDFIYSQTYFLHVV